MYIGLTRDLGHFICFITDCSFTPGNLQSEKITTLTVEEETPHSGVLPGQRPSENTFIIWFLWQPEVHCNGKMFVLLQDSSSSLGLFPLLSGEPSALLDVKLYCYCVALFKTELR